MEKWKGDKDKDVWRENIIYAVKYGLEHSNVISWIFVFIFSSIMKNY